MIFSEIKRKYISVFFLIVVILSGGMLINFLKPITTSNSYDLNKYYYYKPLEKSEFIYFNLIRDYKKGETIEYTDTKGDMFIEHEVRLDYNKRKLFLGVIKTINPQFKLDEKMTDIKIDCSIESLKPLMKSLEKELKIKSFYYTGMYAPEKYNDKFDAIDSPSPYWIYLECTKGIFTYDEFNNKNKIFKSDRWKLEISKTFSLIALDYIGILMSLLSILFSFNTWAEDKRYKVDKYIYTSNISNIKLVMNKYFGTVIPLCIISFIFMILTFVYFIWLNNHYRYGYTIDFVEYFKYYPLIVIPTISITVSISFFVGNIFNNSFITLIIQFIVFYLSMSRNPFNDTIFGTTVRLVGFDNYNLFSKIWSNVLINRVSVLILSGIFIALVILNINVDINIFKKIKLQRNKMVNKLLNLQVCNYLIKDNFIFIKIMLYSIFLLIMLPVTAHGKVDLIAIKIIGENIIIFASIFTFVDMANIEKRNAMEGLVFTSSKNYLLIYMQRFLKMTVVLFFMIMIPLCLLCFVYGVKIGYWSLGIYLSSLYIGSFSLLIAETFENALTGYYIYIAYYLVDVVTKKNAGLTVLGYTKQKPDTKDDLLVATIFIVVILLVIVFLKTKGERISKIYESRDY